MSDRITEIKDAASALSLDDGATGLERLAVLLGVTEEEEACTFGVEVGQVALTRSGGTGAAAGLVIDALVTGVVTGVEIGIAAERTRKVAA